MTGDQLGPYRLTALLGSGGMGEVWRAVDTRKDRQVALKVLPAGLAGDKDFARKFRREAALAAKLTGPNIVPIHDYGEIDGRLFIDMQLLDGPDLGVVLERGPLPVARAVEITAQVARALDVAHRTGLVHRDVKPSNILVCQSSGEDHVYLIDFGISHALDGTTISFAGSLSGTPAYMAPERFVGEGDHRGDIYALGCVLYEALTGQQPFTATSLPALIYAHLTIPAPRPSDRRADIPSRLDEIIARALAKAPDQRYPSAAELAIAARQTLASRGAPTVSSPPPVDPPLPDRQRVTAPGPTGGPRNDRALPSVSPAPVAPSAGSRRRRAMRAAVIVTTTVGLPVAVVTIFTLPGPAQIGSADPTHEAAPLTPARPIEERTLTGHTGPVFAMTTARLDNRPVIVSGSDDNTVRIWDLTTRTPIGQPLTGHTNAVFAVTTAQLNNRPVIISASYDNTVRIWDLTTRTPIGQPLSSDTDIVFAVTTAQLDDRPVIVSGSDDNTVEVRGLATRTPIDQPLAGHTGSVFAVTTAQLDDRPVIISGSDDNTVRIWDLTTGTPIGQPLAGHTGSVFAVTTAQLDNRPVIISASYDNTVRIWDLTTRTPIGQPLTGHTDIVFAVATAQLDNRPVIISASGDDTVRVWDLGARAGS